MAQPRQGGRQAPLITGARRAIPGQPRGGDTMRTILNVIWLVLCGIWMAILYALAGIICFILIITIPFGIAAFRISNYVLWLFGRTIAPREGGMGPGAVIGNIIWVILSAGSLRSATWWPESCCAPRSSA